jgi:hypothetical protein
MARVTRGPRKLVVNGVVIVATLLGIGVVVKAALKQVYVIDTISVPIDLEANGYTPVTVGQRIIDTVTEINRHAAIIKQIGVYAVLPVNQVPSDFEGADVSGTDPDQFHSGRPLDARFALSFDDTSTKYNLSVGGISLATLIFYIRELFGKADTKISGEITVENPAVVSVAAKDEKPAPTKFSIRLRIADKGIVPYKGQPTEQLETLFEHGALKVVEHFDPLNAAYYSYSKREYENALRIVTKYQIDQAKNDKDWAMNLRGLVAHAQHQYVESIAYFTRLRENYPQFAPGLSWTSTNGTMPLRHSRRRSSCRRNGQTIGTISDGHSAVQANSTRRSPRSRRRSSSIQSTHGPMRSWPLRSSTQIVGPAEAWERKRRATPTRC